MTEILLNRPNSPKYETNRIRVIRGLRGGGGGALSFADAATLWSDIFTIWVTSCHFGEYNPIFSDRMADRMRHERLYSFSNISRFS